MRASRNLRIDSATTTTLAAIVMAVLATGCASTSSTGVKVPKPFPTPSGPSAPRTAASTPDSPVAAVAPPIPAAAILSPVVDAVIGTALSLRGTPYRNGGSDPAAGFDCSGFTQFVFAQHGLSLPREVREQFQLGNGVKADKPAKGDLVFFSTVAPGASHVGLVIGDDEFIHAPSSKGVVRVEHLSADYWSRRLVGVRRVN